MEGTGSRKSPDHIPGKLHAEGKSVHAVMRPKCDDSSALTLVAWGRALRGCTAWADTMLACFPESYLQAAPWPNVKHVTDLLNIWCTRGYELEKTKVRLAQEQEMDG